MHFSHHPQHGNHRLLHTERAGRQRGYVLVMFALLLVPLLLMAGLAVDVGSWYSRASDIRRAADAAALAGVVWLPDETKAKAAALEAAARNGFVPSANITIDVKSSSLSTRRLKVTITDNRVGSFFYESLGGKKITLSRTSYAEYVLPVPLGSPRNFFGTGTLLEDYPVAGITPEYLYEAVNPYCTDKRDGDRYQSYYVNNSGTCPGTLNSEYRTKGYQMYVEAPAGRTSPIEIRAYDARYNLAPMGAITTTVKSYENCYWDLGSVQTVNAPITWWNGAAWAVATTGTVNARYVRYPIYKYTDSSPDTTLGCSAAGGPETYTYSVYSADSTPLNDDDNPLLCQKTFTPDTAFDGYSYLGSNRWNTLCTIGTSDPSGRYIVRVTNGGVATTSNGSNNWGLVAKYTNAAGAGLCDGRTDNMCPRVYGVDAISVMAAAETSVASFYLAEIAPEHVGKQLKLELFDPGEGGSKIEIMMPTGTNSWTPVAFSWTATGASPSSGSGTSLDVTGARFNGLLVEINIDLNGYSPPSNNRWWQVRYTFSGDVTDRTTWSARVTGDPVHLVEEF